ncbi:MAG: hypothetical protein EOP10_06235 [Proteobacteria bacterium]|nr:MAG: hypothetical protein EOP10_06235 [Pseudomonadota bacterium]
MNYYIIVSLLLGVVAVFQPMLNRTILDTRGLTFAAWLSSFVLFLIATLIMAIVHFKSERFPDYMRPKFEGVWEWWFVLPGLFGFFLVFLLPLSMRSLGAFVSIVLLLLGQLFTSFIYDALVVGKPVTTARVAGLVFTLIGAYLSFRPAEN